LGAAHAMLDIAMKEPFGIRDPDELDHLIKIASADVLRKILHSPNVRFEHLQPEHKFEEASLHAASFGSIAALEYFESKGLDFSKRKLAWVRREWVSGSVAKEEMNWGYPLNSAKDVAVAEWLVQRGCDPNFREIGVSGGGTPLFNAIANKDLAMVRWYVEKQGASLTVRDDRGYTPLLYACATGGVKELKYLVEKGADLNALLPDGSNAAFACTLGYSSGVGKRLEYLSSKGVALDRPNAAGVYYTSKIRTAADKKFMVAEVVRRHEAGQPLFQPFVRSLWRQLTTSRSNAEGMYRLVRSGALDVSYFRAGQTNPLHSIVILNPYDSLHEVSPSLAGVSATTEIASELLAAGLRIDLRNERGYTPLMEAVSHKNLKAVRFLMEMGANPDIKSLKGKPLSSLTRTDSVRRELISDELARSLESALGDVACGSSNEDVADVDRSSPSSSGSFGML
jgi:ankyrin repeat protein